MSSSIKLIRQALKRFEARQARLSTLATNRQTALNAIHSPTSEKEWEDRCATLLRFMTNRQFQAALATYKHDEWWKTIKSDPNWY